jgi:hypothetical protein
MLYRVWDRLPQLLDTVAATIIPEVVFEGTRQECETFIHAATFGVGIHPSRYSIEEV